MKIYRTTGGAVLEDGGALFALADDWDALINHADLVGHLRAAARDQPLVDGLEGVLAPIGAQEVWAAGVTYLRSRTARMEEAKPQGGGSFYDRVYEAERPELFFKAAGWRVRGPEQPLRVRADSHWNVPEPELALVANARGQLVGYTIGNDMSSRDIEGENPLYLPQAKVYDGSCGLGPALLVHEQPLPSGTAIHLRITRAGATAFEGATSLARMRRTPAHLLEYLFRETSFPAGAVLLTGTGIVPPDYFTLTHGDRVRIEIEGIGVLENDIE